jgi:SPP1 family phage portal protein
VRTEDNDYLRQALIYGCSYEINYIDELGKQRFKVLDPREVIPIYANDLNSELLYVIRYYVADNINEAQEKYYIEVYSKDRTLIYSSSVGFAVLSLLEERPNYFKQVPITVFPLNQERESIFDKVMSLQDAYNKLLSSEVDDFESFCDAYLILKGVQADADDLQAMKQNRVLIMDADAEASYLTKSVSDTQIENMLKNINDTIHKIANSPDFNDDKFMSASGISMRYKLTGFENVSSNIVANMTKALQKRIELICEVINIKGGDSMWRDIDIVFTRNLPVNTLEIAQMVNQLRGLVSDATLLAQLPFVGDVQKELEQLEEQKQANIDMYSFQNNQEETVNEQQ